MPICLLGACGEGKPSLVVVRAWAPRERRWKGIWRKDEVGGAQSRCAGHTHADLLYLSGR